MTPDPVLTAREQIVADKAAAKAAVVMRRVVKLNAIAMLIVIAGGVLGWTVVRHESVHRTNAIQASRVQSSTDNCIEINKRYLGTLEKLDSLIPKHPTAKELQGVQSSKLLIAALVPFTGDPASRDGGASACHAAAVKRVKT